ncbi:hypothetical protein ACXJJ3_22135 [Kribbella sp. WER1]
MKRHSIVGLAGAVALAAAAVSAGTAQAARAVTAVCTMSAGSVTAAGAQTATPVSAGTPPKAGKTFSSPNVFQAGTVRLSTTFRSEPSVAGSDSYGWVVQGDTLYWRFYNVNEGMDEHVRVGSGWANFTALEVAQLAHLEDGKPEHNIAYGLRNDGTLFRWTVSGNTWRSTGSYPGFGAVKSLALIAKTPTYDTFLANTRSGALYTIRIPITSPLKPIVTPVRTSGWQSFETLVAEKCGNYGTLLLGIDKDTKTGNLYAVGHANGTATVINPLGKVDNGTFPDPVNFRWAPVAYYDQLTGG